MSIKDIDESYLKMISSEDDSIEASLIIAVQTLMFNGPNIVVAVKFKKDIEKSISMTQQIIEDFDYVPIIIGGNKIKIEKYQSYIIFESIFDKYYGSNFLTFSILHNEVVQN